MSGLIIKNGTIITMDADRRVLENSAVAIENQFIIEIGDAGSLQKKYPDFRVIDASKKAMLPGFIDGHAHAGHGMIKTMGDGNGEAWYACVRTFYQDGATVPFWKADAQLAALDRLKNGITCGLTYFGGGDSISRVDDPIYALEHLASVKEIGVRELLALGPCRPPYPTEFTDLQGKQTKKKALGFDEQIAITEEVIRAGHNTISDRLQVSVTLPVFGRTEADYKIIPLLNQWAEQIKDLYKKYQLLFTQDGHRSGSIKFQHEILKLSGPDVVFSHCIDLTKEELDICQSMDIKIVHNPSAVASIRGRCPVPELIDKGVTVLLGSDSAAPDRGCDMFRHMFHCMHYQRTYFKDENIMPPGKVLEMVTIDAAKGLGMEKEIGSIEVGKRADLILVDLNKPHLVPLNMIPSRIAYFAHGSDVDTVIVDGQILMENRKVLTVNESDVLDNAQHEVELILDRTGTRDLLSLSENYWGHSHY